MYRVYRDQKAAASLRPLWEQAEPPLQQAILQAMQLVEQQLQTQPHGTGESRPDGMRILFEAPVAVLFRIDEERELVTIVRTWVYGNGSHNQDRAA